MLLFKNKQALRWPRYVLISVFSFIYIFASFGLSGVPQYSRLAIYSSLALSMIFLLKLRTMQLPFWVFILFFFYSYLILPAIYSSNQPIQACFTLISVFLGTTCIGLALHNKYINFNIIVYAMIVASCLNIVSVILGIDTGEIIHQRQFLNRASGLTGNANKLSLSLTYTAFMIWLFPNRFSFFLRLLGVFFVTYGVYVSGSRKGLILLFIFIAMICVQKFYTPKRKIIAIAFFSLLIVASVFGQNILNNLYPYLTNVTAVERSLQIVDGSETSFDIRRSMITQGLQLWEDNPLLGYGLESFSSLSVYGTYSHNNYVEILVAGGLVAFLLFYYIHITIFKNSFLFPTRHRISVWFILGSLLFVDFAAVTFSEKSQMCILSILLVLTSKSVLSTLGQNEALK